jgi:hypothetical protein
MREKSTAASSPWSPKLMARKERRLRTRILLERGSSLVSHPQPGPQWPQKTARNDPLSLKMQQDATFSSHVYLKDGCIYKQRKQKLQNLPFL